MKRVGNAIIILSLAFGQLIISVPAYASDETSQEAGASVAIDSDKSDKEIARDDSSNAPEEGSESFGGSEDGPPEALNTDNYATSFEGSQAGGATEGSAELAKTNEESMVPEAEVVLISKVQVGAKDHPEEEFIELYNPASHQVHLKGWTLEYLSKDHDGSAEPTYTLADLDEVTLEGYGFYILRNQHYVALEGVADITYDTERKNALAQHGSVRLLNDGEVIDLVGWGEAAQYRGEAATPAKYSALERCTDSDGDVVDTHDNEHDFAPHGSALREIATCEDSEPPVDGNGDGDDDEGQVDEGGGVNQCAGLHITEIAPNTNQQFVEVYNSTDKIIDLDGCQVATKRKTAVAVFSNIEIAPYEYEVLYLEDSELTLIKSTNDTVFLLSSDGGIEQDNQEYRDLNPETSWSLIDDVWRQTYTPTPGEANVYTEYKPCQEGYERHEQTNACRKVAIESELKPCAPDQERNPDTNRCRKIQAATTTLKPCLPGQERNPETNRCRKIGTTASSLVPCQPGQERNPETNRCRKVGATSKTLVPCKPGQVRNPDTNRCRSTTASASTLKPCAANQERNPETNRCRKIGTTANSLKPCASGYERNPETNRCRKVRNDKPDVAGYAIESIEDSAQASVGWWAFGGVGVLAAGYGAWEWRREMVLGMKKLGQFFQVSK